ncbi:hypothetical protein HF086_004153 [Spodoptera exigua]|uniref:Glycosyltransferase family 92 protein n=1 Tax=Spodoptera exigua TaxID=7107 RepID=A0A922SDN0_SPOEX|nr:hypothetical protein HF086_004153 [Spodoptera exigua]
MVRSLYRIALNSQDRGWEGLATRIQKEFYLRSKNCHAIIWFYRTEGQFAAFNDCLYRSMSRTGWLLVIDVDEVVFPRRERTLPALLTSLRASYQPRSKAPSAFLFRNAFFYLKWEDDPEANTPLLTSRKTRRWSTPHSLKNRSKYALRPRDAVELGNHFVWELAPGSSSVGVNTDRALLHHYRSRHRTEIRICVVTSQAMIIEDDTDISNQSLVIFE